MHTRTVAPNVTAFVSGVEVPMFGALAINAYLLTDHEPMLVDTGFTPDREDFLETLWNLVDPADLRWLWLTHGDRDHTGALDAILDAAPQAKVVTTFYTVGVMGCGNQPIPPDRALLVRDGTRTSVGGREVVAFRPPLFDNPGTAGFLDAGSGTLFTSDFLGAVLPSLEAALADDAAAVPAADVEAGALTWGSFDSPWIHGVNPTGFEAALDAVRAMSPTLALSTHLPPVQGAHLDGCLDTLRSLPAAAPAVMPDQAAIEAAMAALH